MTSTNWNQLMEDHEVTFLRADICLGSPVSYTLDEKRQICADMQASTEAVEKAMRDDFAAMLPRAQAKMLDILQQVDPEHFDWWLDILTGKTPNSVN